MKKTIASLQASPSAILPRPILSRFTRPYFPFPSSSDACHAGYKVDVKESLINNKWLNKILNEEAIASVYSIHVSLAKSSSVCSFFLLIDEKACI